MNRGTTPACRYCSTGAVLLTVRRAIRRRWRLSLTPSKIEASSAVPDLPLDELDGVARGVAHVDRPATERPADLALDLDPRPAQMRSGRLDLADTEGHMPRAQRAVGWHEAAGRAASCRVEEQNQAAVV